jgi:hypothetical protein
MAELAFDALNVERQDALPSNSVRMAVARSATSQQNDFRRVIIIDERDRGAAFVEKLMFARVAPIQPWAARARSSNAQFGSCSLTHFKTGISQRGTIALIRYQHTLLKARL